MPEHRFQDVPKGREEKNIPNPEVAVELRQRSVERGFADKSGPAPGGYDDRNRRAVITQAKTQRPTYEEAYRRGVDASVRHLGERIASEIPVHSEVSVELGGHTLYASRSEDGVEFRVDDHVQTSAPARDFFANNLVYIQEALRRKLEQERQSAREREEQELRDKLAKQRESEKEEGPNTRDYGEILRARERRQEEKKEQASSEREAQRIENEEYEL